MARNVHLALHGEALGIVPMQDLLVRVSRGEYAPETLAWIEGEAEWLGLTEFVSRYGHGSNGSVFHGSPATTARPEVRAARKFFAELGADIETCIRVCEVLPQRGWVRWDDGQEENFPLPVTASAGQKVVMLGVRVVARVGALPAISRDGAPLFTVPEEGAYCWCMVENTTTKARWSELGQWLDRFMNEAGRSAIESAIAQGFDLDKAATSESSRPFYMTSAVLLPPLVAVGMGMLVWWGASFILTKPVSALLGVVVGGAIFIVDLRSNIKNGIFKYERVQKNRVKDVQDGITVRSTMSRLEKFVLESFAGG